MRQLLLTLAFSCISLFAAGQSFNYINGTLDLTISGFNPCGGGNTGYLSIRVNGADGGGAVLIFLDGPGANDDAGVPIITGDTYNFNVARTLPAGTYQMIIRDLANNFTINTFADPVNYPPLVLTAITPPALSEDVRIDNSSCTLPTTGQIQSSISGGSMVLAGGGSFDYTWTADNGLAGLPLSGTTDGTTPLDLATLLGVPGLPGGNYTLTIRDNYSSNLGVPCSAVRVFSLSDPSPTVFTITTVSPLSICSGDNIVVDLNGSDAATVTYEVFRNGVATGITFPGTGAPLNMVFPSAGFNNGDVIQIRATDGFCSPATMNGSVVLNVSPIPTVDAGLPQTICSDATATLAGVIGGSATSATWTTSGDGSFDNAALLNALYTPGPNDIINGTVTLTLTTNDPAGPCPAVADNVVITVDPAATVDAGLPQTICSDASASLAGIIGGSAVSSTWSTSGDGSFDNVALLNAVYTPGANDITNGTVTLTLTTNDPAGPCPAVADNVVITVEPAATVDAGLPQTICSDAGGVALAGSIGGSAVSATWSTSGDGAFDNTALLTATYTPGPNDITNGTVTLTLTTNDPAGPCPAAADNVVITIDPAATVDAGLPQTICSDGSATLSGVIGGGASGATWTSSGDGSFDNATLLNAVYTPGATDITNGNVTLTLTTNDPAGPCVAAVDNVVISIDLAATVDAGVPQTICSDGTVTLTGAIGGVASSATWSTAGDGSFNNPALLNAIYTPGPNDITGGTVTLTLTTNDPAGPCVPAVDNVVITINPEATVDAGPPQTICAGGTVTLAGVIGGGATSATWSTSGDGSFNNASLLNAVYTPGVNDLAAGTVTLTLTTNDPAGPCGPANDNVVITIDPAATVDAGLPQTICSNATASLAGVFGGSATSATWSTSGDGSFDNVALLNAIYTPGPNDITNGTVTLTLTTNDPVGACPAVSDNVIITINIEATVDAGLPQTICSDGTVALAGVIGGSAASATWSTSGDGTFNNASLLNAIYTPGANDLTNGTVTLTLTTNDPAGPCGPAIDNVVITIDPAATVDAGGPQTVCSNGTATLAGVIGGSATSATWSTSGDGTFDNPASLTAIYTPGPTDITNGTVVLTLATDDPAGGCPAVSDNVTITISAEPTVDSGLPQTVCSDATVSLTGVIGGSASSVTWSSSGDGSFDNVSSLTATYTPGANDITNGTVTLTLTTNDPAGPCVAAADNVIITIDPAATVDAGTPQTVCGNATVTLAGAIGGSATTSTWSTAGDGSFDDPTLLGAVYTPGPNDVIAGTVTLTLTTDDPAGTCPVVADNVVITISPLPDASFAGLAGPYCENDAVVTLTPTTPGGTFSGPGVTGNTFDPALAGAGSYVIQYEVTVAGCTAISTQNVDVNPLPSAVVSGGGTVCSTDPLPDVTFTFTGTAPFDFTYSDGSTTFPVTGYGSTIFTLTNAPAGTYSIVVLTDATTCSATSLGGSASVIVNQPTATISGTTSICNGSSTNITVNFTGTSPWNFQYSDGVTTSPVIPSFFNSITFPVSPATTTTYTIVSVSDGSGCTGVGAGSAIVTVSQPADPSLAVSVSIDPVCSGGSSDIIVAASEVGVSYQLRNDADDSNVGAPVVGTGGPISIPTGPLVATTTFNVFATSPGCTGVELTNTATVNVTGSIDPGLTVTAVDDPVCSGNSTFIRIASSETGVTYDLRNDADNSLIASAAGTGGDIDIPTGVLTATITYNILASNGTCSIQLSATPTVNVDPNPDPSLAVSATIDPLCSGGSTTLQVVGSEVGVDYQLRNDFDDSAIGAPVAGTGGTILLPTGALAATTTFNVLAITGGACASVELTTLVTINVSGAVDLTLAVAPVDDPICEGSSTFIRITASEVGVNYQLRDNSNDSNVGVALAGTGADLDLPTGNLATTTTFNILADNGTCSAEMQNLATVNVEVNPDPTLVASATIDPLCTGGVSGIRILNSQVGVSYQLRDDFDDSTIGAPVAGTGATIVLSTGVLNATTTFNVLATGGAACPAVELTALVTINVSGTVDASLVTTAAPGTICEGDATFIEIAGSEVGVDYQLRDEATDANIGTLVAGTGGTINLPTGNLSATTTFNVLASNGTCSIELTDTETVTVDPAADPSLAVAATSTLICPNGSTSITVALSEVGVSYQLRNDADDSPIGAPVVGTGGTISLPTGPLTANTTYNVLATIGGNCPIELNQKPIVTVRPIGDPACGGGGGVNCGAFTALINLTRPSCTDQDDGIFQISVTGGTGSYILSLYDSLRPGAPFFQSLPATSGVPVSFTMLSPSRTYFYKIDDGVNICELQYSIDLQSIVTASADPASFVDALCFGEPTGSAIINATNSTTGEYYYSLDDGATWTLFTPGNPINNLPPNGTYNIQVGERPNDVCRAYVPVTINSQLPAITAAFDVTQATCNGSDGGITINAAAGAGGGPYEYSINNGVTFQTSNVFDNLSGGAYAVVIRDATGCTGSFTTNVTFPGFINHLTSSTPADCDNNGNSGSISLTITDTGVFQVAISQDQFNEPDDTEYLPYPNQPVSFDDLPSGTYYVYIKSGGTTCPTRSAPVVINGVIALRFEIEPVCDGNERSIDLNIISADTSVPFTVHVYDSRTGVEMNGFPLVQPAGTAVVILGYDQFTFLQSQGEYTIELEQISLAAFCSIKSELDYQVLPPLEAFVRETTSSPLDIDIGTITLEVINGTGAPEYSSFIRLDSAAALTQFYEDNHTSIPQDLDGRYMDIYENVPAGRYEVIVTDADGCFIELFPPARVPLDTRIIVPNIFTPNDDDVNDTFYIRNLPESGNQLVITNRWGNEVFTSSDYNRTNFWDGSGVDDGTYYYNLKVSDGQVYKGWVEIMRGKKP